MSNIQVSFIIISTKYSIDKDECISSAVKMKNLWNIILAITKMHKKKHNCNFTAETVLLFFTVVCCVRRVFSEHLSDYCRNFTKLDHGNKTF